MVGDPEGVLPRGDKGVFITLHTLRYRRLIRQ